MQHSLLIEKYLKQLKSVSLTSGLPVLDLACGNGRNGFYLVENDIQVTFADINANAIAQGKQHASLLNREQQADFWLTDFEQKGEAPLADKSYAAIMVFRYLHRPLLDQIKQAVSPNGLIIYETFTTAQTQFGRPNNPDFLLKEDELGDIFSDWEILHQFEGVIESVGERGDKQAIAQIVARKPSI